MSDSGSKLFKHAMAGAGSGVVGTVVLFALRSFDTAYAPKTIAKGKQDPGEFIIDRAEDAADADVSAGVKHGLAVSSNFVYGSFWGLLYALLHVGADRPPSHPLLTGGLLGVAVWSAGYMGWLPALGLTKPAWKQPYPEVIGSMARHAAYGVATALTYRAIEKAV